MNTNTPRSHMSTAADALVLALLRGEGDGADWRALPPIGQIARACNLDPATVRQALRALADAGTLHVRREAPLHNRNRRRNGVGPFMYRAPP